MNAATRARGFTLIEIMVVIVLIAVISGLTIGLLGVGREGRELRGAVATMSTQLRYARTRALITGVSQTFAMDLDSLSWKAADHHGNLPKAMQVSFNAVRQEQPSAHEAAIRFFPDGSSTGGRINLRTKGVGWRVDVLWLTGEVSATRLPDAGR